MKYIKNTDKWNDAISFEFQSFIKKAREGKWKSSHPYIYDLTDIFDGEDDIYLDSSHVKERGNKIIADEIYKRIVKIIELII